MDKLEQEKLPEDMTDEEREEYLRKQEIYENAANTLQGAIACMDFIPQTAQMAYGPPVTPSQMFQPMMGIFPSGFTQQPKIYTASWIEPGKWQCVCGSINTSKFCPECGADAPPKAWKCPNCGHENEGKFCPECGTPRPDAAAD